MTNLKQQESTVKTLFAILSLNLLLTVAARSGPLPQNQIAADAKWLIHLDLDNLRQTKIGEFLTSQYLNKEIGKKLDEFKAQLKIDADLDVLKIASITAYGTDYKKKPDADGVLMIHTGQDVEKVVEALLGALAEHVPDEASRPVKKLQQAPFALYGIGKGDLFAAIHNKNLILASKSRNQLEKALGVVAGKEGHLGAKNAFSGYPKMEGGFFFIGLAEGFNEQEGIPAQAKVLQMADGGRLVFGERTERLFANLTLHTKNAESSTQLQQMVSGVVAFAALSQAENKDLQQLAQSIKTTADGNFVSVNVEYPVASALKMFDQQVGGKRRKPALLEDETPAKKSATETKRDSN